MAKLTLNDIDVTGKKVMMRVDFNVPIIDGEITDDNRVRAALPSINFVIENGGLVILTSHLGRPKGERNQEFSLKPVADHLATLIDAPVHFANDCIGDDASEVIDAAKLGEVIVLENVRFYKEETDNDEDFSKQLAARADLFVNDAFGSSHRAHASVAGVTKFLQPAVSGYLLEKEIFLSSMQFVQTNLSTYDSTYFCEKRRKVSKTFYLFLYLRTIFRALRGYIWGGGQF